MADTIAKSNAPGESRLQVRVTDRFSELDPIAWDALDHGASPFLRHGFQRALVESGSVGARVGWLPIYVLVESVAEPAPPRLVGATIAYVKSHSYGEYIFDWAWANAAARGGIEYYPKLVVAAPATPATGKRLLLADGIDREGVIDLLCAAVRALADDAGCSSIHWLFVTDAEATALAERGFARRASFQFHWHNHGYAGFDDLLAAMSSRKRKQIRKERLRAVAGIDRISWKRGDELSAADLAAVDRFYRHTVDEHGGMDYLRPGFFDVAAKALPQQMVVAFAERDGCSVAGALFFETEAALYGRYWGTDEDHPFLHFELAYYQGIDRAIAGKLPLFEAGAQGEHKLLRGFVPSATHSCHWIRDERLFTGIRGFLADEARSVAERMAGLAAHAPFRSDDESV